MQSLALTIGKADEKMSKSKPEIDQGHVLSNETFSAQSIQAYLNDYAVNLQRAVTSVDPQQLNGVLDLFTKVLAEGNKIYVCGNGGSAAIADHLCCDWSKGTHFKNVPSLKTQSLTSNSALLTAVANDFGFEKAFSQQLEMFGEPGDVLIAISSSGNSENILQAVEKAKLKSMTVVGLSGFAGGRLKEACHLSLFVPFKNYGLVEDAHQILMHVLAQFFTLKRSEKLL
jgi:phosphoheptose isomerase